MPPLFRLLILLGTQERQHQLAAMTSNATGQTIPALIQSPFVQTDRVPTLSMRQE